MHSEFKKKSVNQSGISRLMDDLGKAMAEGGDDMLMLGGGNPAHIPEVQQALRENMEKILATEGAFERMIGNYDTPQGNAAFINALVNLLNEHYNWDLGPENIALTNGSQSAFFSLFNIYGGLHGGREKKICLPLAPEYIGYADQGLGQDFFEAGRPEITYPEEQLFKYCVDFENLNLHDDISAICASRPTNPTGNVLTDEEVTKICELAAERDIPFMLDSAYGTPFPNIIFTDAKPFWNRQIILCMSLSKFGLPACRTGIVIANADIIQQLTEMNGIIGLAPTSIGPLMALDLVTSGKILELSESVIKPYYQRKVEHAVAKLHDAFKGLKYYIHKPEGAMFLWLWMPELPISSKELYERLKKRGVLVVSGHYFFPGISDDWEHQHQCIRITYSQDDKKVAAGIEIIADELRNL